MSVLPQVIQQLSNREIAVATWTFLFLIWAVSRKEVRRGITPLVRILFKKQILLVFTLMLGYILGLLVVLNYLQLVNISQHIKDVVIWTITVAFGLVFSTDAFKDETFFRKTLIATLTSVVIINAVDVFANLYSFKFIFELLLVLFLSLLTICLAVTEISEETRILIKPIRFLITILGWVILLYSLKNLVVNWESIDRADLLTGLILPPVLTILFLPFVYGLAVFAAYESTFVRLKIWNKGSIFLPFAKRKIVLAFGLNLRALLRWSKHNPRLKFDNKEQLIQIINNRSDKDAL